MTHVRYATIFFVLLLFTQSQGIAQEDKPENMPDMAEMMKLAQPGPEHEILKRFVGDWTVDMDTRMQPEGPVTKMSSEGSAEMILGGRFVKFEMTTMMMGMESNLMHIMGFDRRFNNFFFFGIDTFGTYYIAAKGAHTGSEDKIEMEGVEEWPGMAPRTFKFIYEFKSDSEYTFQILFPDEEGNMFPMIEGTAKKKS